MYIKIGTSDQRRSIDVRNEIRLENFLDYAFLLFAYTK